MLEKIAPYLVAVFVPIVTGLISYFLATKNAKSETKKIIQQYKLESKNYITKAKFDVELEIYQELTDAIVRMVFDNNMLYPVGMIYIPSDESEKKEYFAQNYNNACESYSIANRLLYKNAAFIPKSIYDRFIELIGLCRLQISFYPDLKLGAVSEAVRNEMRGEFKECRERTKTISSMIDLLLEYLRDYLNSLEIIKGE